MSLGWINFMYVLQYWVLFWWLGLFKVCWFSDAFTDSPRYSRFQYFHIVVEFYGVEGQIQCIYTSISTYLKDLSIFCKTAWMIFGPQKLGWAYFYLITSYEDRKDWECKGLSKKKRLTFKNWASIRNPPFL